jgi:hypothetical protein
MLSEHNPRRTWQGGPNWAGHEGALISSVVVQGRLSPLLTCGIITNIKTLFPQTGEPLSFNFMQNCMEMSHDTSV